MTRLFALLVAALGLIAVPASAQSDSDARKARQALHSFSECVAKRDSDLARRMVLGNFDAMNEADKGSFYSPFCLRQTPGLKVDRMFINMAMAEYFLKQDYSLEPPVDSDERMLKHYSAIPKFLEQEAIRSSEWMVEKLMQEYLGICMNETAPRLVTVLLETRVGSETERAAMAAISATARKCVYEGRDMPLNYDVVRGSAAMMRYWAHDRGEPDA